ncbi:MAG: DUF4845 domain-containing protein [Pseudomonadota bacterium]
MKLKNSQRGMTFWSTVFILFIIGFGAFIVLKLTPVYLEDLSIGSALDSVKDGAATKEYSTVSNVRSAIMKRFNVNNIDVISAKDVEVLREGDSFGVNVNYEVIVPFLGNVSLLLTFDHSVSVPVADR